MTFTHPDDEGRESEVTDSSNKNQKKQKPYERTLFHGTVWMNLQSPIHLQTQVKYKNNKSNLALAYTQKT